MNAESATKPPIPTASELTCGLVLHFRSASSTAACLVSLQEEGIDRLLLVDNSEDQGRSLGELGPALAAFRSKGMQIAVLEPGINLGFSAGVNRGLAAIREQFGACRVLLINSDAQLLPGSLGPLKESVDSGADIAAPLLQSPEGKLKRAMYYHRLTGLLSARNFPGTFAHLSGCCLLLSVGVAQADLLDERFFFYGEDAYLGWEVLRTGRRATVVESARALHIGSGSSRRGSLFYEYHMARAHLELGRALALSPLETPFLLLGRGVVLPVRAAWRSTGQASLVPLMGLLLALGDFAKGRVRTLTPGEDGKN